MPFLSFLPLLRIITYPRLHVLLSFFPIFGICHLLLFAFRSLRIIQIFEFRISRQTHFQPFLLPPAFPQSIRRIFPPLTIVFAAILTQLFRCLSHARIIQADLTGAQIAELEQNPLQTTAIPEDFGAVPVELVSFTANVEQNDAPVENIIMHAQQYRNIRTLAGDTFDPVTRRELIKTGYMGDLWGAAIRITKKANTTIILAAASPEFLGVISVRIDLDQMDSPQGELLQYGWVFYEYVGMAQLTTVGSGRWNVS